MLKTFFAILYVVAGITWLVQCFLFVTKGVWPSDLQIALSLLFSGMYFLNLLFMMLKEFGEERD